MEKKIQGPQIEQKRVEPDKKIPPPIRAEEQKEKERMLTENEEEDKKFEETNVLPFNRPATGIKEPTDNWLIALALHTCFVCRPKGPTSHSILDLVEYHVTFKTDKGAVRLLSNQNEEKVFWVDSARFSRQMELFEVLGVATDD